MKNSNTVKLESKAPGRYMSEGAFEYKGDMCFVTKKVNYKPFYAIYYMSMRPFTQGISLMRYNKTTRKITKTETIPLDVEGTYYNLEKVWHKDNMLNVYTSYYNKSTKLKYLFCTRYNLDTKKSKTFKVFESAKKDNLDIIMPDGSDKIALVSMDKTARKSAPVFNYCVADHEMNILAEGAKIKLNNFTSSDIDNYTISKNNKLVIETTKKLRGKNIFSKGKI
jgi:hypothetical protein